VSLYVLFYITLIKSQPRTVIISPVTPEIFNELYLKYNKTLACRCTNDTVPYKAFVSNTIKYHPVCSSTFVSQKWIEALYFPNASMYGVTDFRTTASSQVRLYLMMTMHHIFYPENIFRDDYFNTFLFSFSSNFWPVFVCSHKIQSYKIR
jgi:hypothetical protein